MYFDCPHCGQAIRGEESMRGQQVMCAKCRKTFRVPEMTPESPQESTSSESDQQDQELWAANPAMLRGRPKRTLGFGIMALACIIALAGVFGAGAPRVFAVIILVIMALSTSIWWLQCKAARLIITKDRTVLRTGIVSKQVIEVQHTDVRTVQVNQGPLERILGVGSIAIGSAGHAGMEIVLAGLPDPEAAATMIRKQRS